MATPTPATDPARRPASLESRGGDARERLLVAGTRLVADQGIDAINTNVIARAARVGVGTFYGQFEDKHAFHRAVVARGLEVVRAALADAHAEVRDRPVAEQVRAGVTALVEIAAAQPDLFKATFSRAAGGRRGASLGLSPRPVEQRLRALQAEGSVDAAIDCAVAARAFTEMQVSSVSWWLDEPTTPARTALIETLTRMHPALACRSPRAGEDAAIRGS